MAPNNGNREQGVEFGSLAEDLKAEAYPLNKKELLAEYGPHEIDMEDGTHTLQNILGPMGEVTYESSEDIVQDVIGNVGQDAIGRKNYTDRGGTSSGGEREEESF